ncbi:MAG: hypothetical protein ACOZNI_07365 [Myxococcota bacterium]
MGRQAALLTESNLFDFFRERVETAVVHQRAPVSENAVYYLSNLLAENARRGEGPAEEDEPTLVELQHRAVHAPPAEAVTHWRRLGDNSLVVAGFFRESLERRAVSRDYYERMGSTAYRALERILGGGSFAEIFAELGDRYRACVEVLSEVRDEARERTDTDILKLYEEWLTTGSPRVADRLRALGVVPARCVGQG